MLLCSYFYTFRRCGRSENIIYQLYHRTAEFTTYNYILCYVFYIPMYIIVVPCQVSVPRPTRVRGRPFCRNGLALPTASGGPYDDGGGRAPRCSRAGDRVCKKTLSRRFHRNRTHCDRLACRRR